MLIMLISSAVSYWASNYDGYCLTTLVLAAVLNISEWGKK